MARRSRETQRLIVTLPVRRYAALKDRSERENISMSSILNRLLDDYLADVKPLEGGSYQILTRLEETERDASANRSKVAALEANIDKLGKIVNALIAAERRRQGLTVPAQYATAEGR